MKLASIKTKILLAVLGIIFFFGSLATIFVFFYSRQYLIDEKKIELTILTQDKSDDLAAAIHQIQLISQKVSQAPKIVESLENPNQFSQKDITSALEHHNIDKIYSALYVMDKDGLTIGSTDQSFIGKNYSFRQYFKQAIAGNFYIDIALGITSNQLGFYFSFPIKSSQDEIIGVAVSKVRPEVITNLASHQSLDSVSDIIITDDKGVIIYSKKFDRLYHSLGQVSEEIIKDEQEDRFPQKEIKALHYQQIQDEILNPTGKQALEFYDSEDKKRELLIIDKLEDLPFYFIIEQDINEITKVAGKATILLSIFVLAAAISAATIISLIISRFLYPLIKLTESANQYSQGNLDYSPDIKPGNDEIGSLSQALISMAQSLKKTQDNIQKEISKKTIHLKKLNKFMVNREIKMIELKKRLKEKSNKQIKK